MRIVIDSLEIRKSNFQELLGKLRMRLEPLLRRNGLRLNWRVDDLADRDALTPEQALHCIRVIPEATSNVIQHARATEIEIAVAVAAAGEPQPKTWSLKFETTASARFREASPEVGEHAT
jgi:two-component system sensor histidine kinase DevS